MGFDTDRMKLREVLKKSGNMKMGGSHTKKVEFKGGGTKVDYDMVKGKGIAEVKKGKQGSSGIKSAYEMIAGNSGKLDSSSGIHPKKASKEKSGIGADNYNMK